MLASIRDRFFMLRLSTVLALLCAALAGCGPAPDEVTESDSAPSPTVEGPASEQLAPQAVSRQDRLVQRHDTAP